MTLGMNLRTLLLAVLLATAGCADKSDRELLALARDHLQKNDRPAATIELKNLLQKFPKSGEGRFLLGQVLFESGDAAAAEAQLREALTAGHPDSDTLPLLATVMVSLGQFPALVHQFGALELKDDRAAAQLKTQLAIAHLSTRSLDDAEAALGTALQRAPGHLPALVLQGRLKLARGDAPGALAQMEDLLSRHSGHADGWLLKGDLLALRSKADAPAAIEAYRKALGIDNTLVTAHAAVLSLLTERQDFDAAGKQFAEMKRALPKHPQTLYFEALLALKRGESMRVREITEALLRGPQQDPRVLLLAGQAEMQMNSNVQAEALLVKALKLAPQAAPPRRMLAQLYLAGGQADQALAVLKPLFEGSGQDAGLWVLQGRAQLMAGDARSAEASFARAAGLRPDDKRIQASTALARLGQGQAGPALNELEAVARADGGTTADLALISERLRRGELDAALKAVDGLAAKQPKAALPDLLRGRIAMQRRDTAAARRHFEAALSKEPAHFGAQASLAALDVSEGKRDVAQARFKSVLQRDPGHAQAHLALAELAARGEASKEDVTRLLAAGVAANPAAAALRAALIDQHMDDGNTAQALSAAQDAVAALPDQIELLDRLGRVQWAAGDINQAVPTFNKMVMLQPRSALPHLRLAELHGASGNSEGAAASVRRAMEADPASLAAQRAGIALALRAKRPAQALAIARTVQSQRANEAVGLLLEGEIELAQKNFDAAAAAFRKALVKPDGSAAAAKVHQALTSGGKAAEAGRMAEAWQKSHPDDVAFVLYLADTALSQDNTALAEMRYRAVLKHQPDHVNALNNLAYLLARLKKPGAVELAERAVRLAPNRAPLLDTLALSYAQENQLAKAVESQSKAVALAPDAHDFRLSLARLQMQAGNKAAARVELDKLAAQGTRFAGHDEVRQLLKSLGS